MTLEQAISLRPGHHVWSTVHYYKSRKRKSDFQCYRVSGRPRVTDSYGLIIPVKFGFYDSFWITQESLYLYSVTNPKSDE